MINNQKNQIRPTTKDQTWLITKETKHDQQPRKPNDNTNDDTKGDI